MTVQRVRRKIQIPILACATGIAVAAGLVSVSQVSAVVDPCASFSGVGYTASETSIGSGICQISFAYSGTGSQTTYTWPVPAGSVDVVVVAGGGGGAGAKTMTAVVESGDSAVEKPTTGSSHVSILPQKSSAMPRNVDPIARMMSGIVMTFGDSWGWTSSSHRALPKKVIATIRVM